MEKSEAIYSVIQGKYNQSLMFTTWKFLIGYLPPDSWLFSEKDFKKHYEENVLGAPKMVYYYILKIMLMVMITNKWLV